MTPTTCNSPPMILRCYPGEQLDDLGIKKSPYCQFFSSTIDTKSILSQFVLPGWRHKCWNYSCLVPLPLFLYKQQPKPFKTPTGTRTSNSVKTFISKYNAQTNFPFVLTILHLNASPTNAGLRTPNVTSENVALSKWQPAPGQATVWIPLRETSENVPLALLTYPYRNNITACPSAMSNACNPHYASSSVGSCQPSLWPDHC